MEKEISSGAMLGIVLIALAAVIGLGFGIFAIARGTANEGVSGLQDSLGQVSTSAFTDFDQKIVTGTQVVSAYNNFAGKPYAILVATQAFIDKMSDSSISSVPKMDAYANDTTPMTVQTSSGTTVNLKYINYNAQLAGGKVIYNNGMLINNGGFKLTTGSKIDFYTITGNMSKSGMIEYVPSSGRFQANLIKDSSGTIMGIAFQQIAVK